MARRTTTPSYRLHKSSGQAIVTLTDAVTGRRKDVLLGQHDTQASRVEYARVLAEWEARGRRLDAPASADFTVAELLLRFMKHAEDYYGRKSKEYDHFDKTIVPLLATFPHKPAKDFAPADLKIVRQRMVDHHGWSRKLVNRRIGRIRFIWKWSVEDGLVPASAWHGLLVVRGLQAGNTNAREIEDRLPVSEEVVAATLPHLPRHVAGLVRFMQTTGARPAEACRLRMADVDTSGDVWLYRPKLHKNVWRGHARQIGIGPEGKKLLAEFIDGLTPEDYVFSPYRQREDIFAVKRTARKTKAQPSQLNRKKKRAKKVPGLRFRTDSFGRAIARACKAHRIPSWCPCQLRHAAGARARRRLGLDAAQALLGHRTVAMTEHYSKLAVDDIMKVAARLG
jgi:integrase